MFFQCLPVFGHFLAQRIHLSNFYVKHGGSGVESLSLTLPMFHESLFLTPGFFPWKQRNIHTATLKIVDRRLLIADWNKLHENDWRLLIVDW